MRTVLSLRSVVAVARAHNRLRTEGKDYLGRKDHAALSKMVRATAASLATLSRGGLADDVRLSHSKVTSMLWALYKAAKAEQRARAAMPEPDLSGAELGAARDEADALAVEKRAEIEARMAEVQARLDEIDAERDGLAADLKYFAGRVAQLAR